MFSNKTSTDSISTYDKGLLFIADYSEQEADWYRIMPCTEKEYEELLGR